MLCAEEEEPRIISDRVLGYCMIISVVFLTITTVIYVSLRELRLVLFTKTCGVNEFIKLYCTCAEKQVGNI